MTEPVPTITQIAEAFSGHTFDAAFPHLADDVRWDLVGAEPLTGKAAVVAACQGTAAELAEITSSFDTFRVITAENAFVVHSVGRYVDRAGGTTVVASCDIYDFAGTTVTAITSYTVELPA